MAGPTGLAASASLPVELPSTDTFQATTVPTHPSTEYRVPVRRDDVPRGHLPHGEWTACCIEDQTYVRRYLRISLWRKPKGRAGRP